jgi:hypothetical protein
VNRPAKANGAQSRREKHTKLCAISSTIAPPTSRPAENHRRAHRGAAFLVALFPGRGMITQIVGQGATPMFARVVEFSPTSEAASQFVQLIEQTALRSVNAQAGCVAAFVEVRGHEVLGVSVWESTADAERYSRECYPDIENMLRPFLKSDPRLHTSEVRDIQSVVVRGALWCGAIQRHERSLHDKTRVPDNFRMPSTQSS